MIVSIVVNIYYTGKNGSAQKFVREMESSGTVDKIRAEEGNLRYEYFLPVADSETVLLIDCWKNQEAIDRHHASPMMEKITELREKYDLHMKVERYLSDEDGIPEKDRRFIKEKKMVKQTAGRDQLGEFAPKFAQLNDDVLFGEVWSREEKLSLRDRSLVTVVSLMAQGLVDSSFQYHLISAKNNGITKEEIAEILTHAAFYAGWPKAWAAFKMAKEVWTEE